MTWVASVPRPSSPPPLPRISFNTLRGKVVAEQAAQLAELQRRCASPAAAERRATEGVEEHKEAFTNPGDHMIRPPPRVRDATAESDRPLAAKCGDILDATLARLGAIDDNDEIMTAARVGGARGWLEEAKREEELLDGDKLVRAIDAWAGFSGAAVGGGDGKGEAEERAAEVVGGALGVVGDIAFTRWGEGLRSRPHTGNLERILYKIVPVN